MSQGLLIILDGLGDRPSPALNGLTPLQAAHTPVMDGLLAQSSCGLVDTLSAGFPVDTHTGSAALMGIDRKSLLSLARGPVEAAGVGVETVAGDILLRANFATLKPDGISIIDRRAGRISKGTEELAQALQDIDLGDGIRASVFPATHHRAVVRLRGKGLSPAISNTDPCRMFPGAKLLPARAIDPADKKAIRTAQALNTLMHKAFTILNHQPLNWALELPANALLTRGAGSASAPVNLLNELGLKVAVISGDRTLHGLAHLFGFEVIFQKGFTAAHDTDLAEKFSAAIKALEKHDMVYLHIKATDIFSHNKDAQGKKIFLESVDKSMGSINSRNLVIGISGDHSTDSNSGNHCGDPVPSLLYATGSRIDSAKYFCESDCNQGGLGRINASGFLHSMLDLMGRLPNYRPRDAAFID